MNLSQDTVEICYRLDRIIRLLELKDSEMLQAYRDDIARLEEKEERRHKEILRAIYRLGPPKLSEFD